MTAQGAQTPWQDALVEHHDYVWARLPFIVPMAAAVARRRGDRHVQAIAQHLAALHPIVLDHLSREETALARHSARAIRARLHADHVAVGARLDRLREATSNATARADGDPTERLLFAELSQLDAHLAAQIAIEEGLLGMP